MNTRIDIGEHTERTERDERDDHDERTERIGRAERIASPSPSPSPSRSPSPAPGHGRRRADVMSSPLAGRSRPLIMAHRGASALAAENTLRAFRLALDAGADIVETDLRLTRDERIVCFHDPNAERLTGELVDIASATAGELDRLTIRAPGAPRSSSERIAHLDQLLDLIPGSTVLALELKDPRLADPPATERLVEALAERIRARSVFALSFDLGILHAVRRAAPALPIGHITMRRPLPLQSADLLGPYWRLLTLNPFYVRHAHARGRWVAPLDPDPHARLGYYLRKDVDAVLTDDPAETRRRLEALRAVK